MLRTGVLLDGSMRLGRHSSEDGIAFAVNRRDPPRWGRELSKRRCEMSPKERLRRLGGRGILGALLLFMASGSGCSSLADLSGYGDRELGDHGPHLFGGVGLDSAVLKRPIVAQPGHPDPGPFEPLRFVFALFDLPFALVADTALLPVTGLNELIVAHDRAAQLTARK
jgi:uncharacterized protein YceK